MAAKHSTPIPDFIKMGIMKRKLTRKEARKITKEIMALKIEDPQRRATLAIIRAIEIANQ